MVFRILLSRGLRNNACELIDEVTSVIRCVDRPLNMLPLQWFPHSCDFMLVKIQALYHTRVIVLLSFVRGWTGRKVAVINMDPANDFLPYV